MIGMPGELLWAVYAPVGTKGNDDGDDEIKVMVNLMTFAQNQTCA